MFQNHCVAVGRGDKRGGPLVRPQTRQTRAASSTPQRRDVVSRLPLAHFIGQPVLASFLYIYVHTQTHTHTHIHLNIENDTLHERKPLRKDAPWRDHRHHQDKHHHLQIHTRTILFLPFFIRWWVLHVVKHDTHTCTFLTLSFFSFIQSE